IKEYVITEVLVRHSKWGADKEPTTIIEYTAKGTHLSRSAIFLTRQEAETAGAGLMAQAPDKWRPPNGKGEKEDRKRGGMAIVEALDHIANERARKLRESIETLKEKMMDAVRYSYTEGPKVTRRTYGADEITAQNLLEFFQKLLSEADIDGWSEEEIH